MCALARWLGAHHFHTLVAAAMSAEAHSIPVAIICLSNLQVERGAGGGAGWGTGGVRAPHVSSRLAFIKRVPPRYISFEQDAQDAVMQ